jgi:hypothetical protein
VLTVNWKTVRTDPDLKRICKGAEVERLFSQLDLAEETVTEFAVYGAPGVSAHANNGLIAKGSFDTTEVVKKLIKMGWIEQDLDGRRVYVDPTHASWLTAFSKSLFVLGTESGVRDAIGAKSRSENRFTSNPTYKVLSSHFEGKQYPIVLMVAMPQASQDLANAAVQLAGTAMNLAGVGPLGDLLNKIGLAQGLGCAISHKDDLFPVVVSAVMNEESAKIVSGALGLLKSLGGSLSKNYSSQTGAGRAIERISVERKREVVSVKMTMSARDLGSVS